MWIKWVLVHVNSFPAGTILVVKHLILRVSIGVNYVAKSFLDTNNYNSTLQSVDNLIETNSIRYFWMIKQDIHLFSCKRSGTHALVTWILHHWREHCCWAIDNPRTAKIHINKKSSGFAPERYPQPRDKHGDGKEFPIRIWSYETPDEESLTNGALSEWQKNGEWKPIYLALLRDPFNYMASLAMFNGRQVDGWARKYLRFINLVHSHPLIHKIYFHTWFSDTAYRRSISKIIGMKHTDNGLDIVKSIGSSFQKNIKNGRELKVLNRWEQIYESKDREIWLDAFRNHPELIDWGVREFHFCPPCFHPSSAVEKFHYVQHLE